MRPDPDEHVHGFGLQLKSFTRADRSERCFATRWLVFLYLPIVPMDRFYLREGSTTDDYYAVISSKTTTRYIIYGESRLRPAEVLRTYLFWWVVGPVVALLFPALLMLNGQRLSDALAPGAAWPVLAVTGLAFLLFVGGLALLATLTVNYRKRWAPVREVRWVEKPRTHADELADFDDFRGFD